MKAQSLLGAVLLPLLVSCGGGGGAANDASVAKAKKQSPKGAQVYQRECAGCHGNSGQGLGGTPEVLGAAALPLKGVGGDHGPFRNAQDVFDYVKREMPLPKSKAGSLSDEDCWAVVEYMLAGSGRDVGPGLTAENAASVVVNK
ncbi:MAG TPA: cytochrome c [Polyangiaceae bacterium]|nr:cytochrome c [Polyangiaceae bacterium]